MNTTIPFPTEIVYTIYSFLPVTDLLTSTLTCSEWWKPVVSMDSFWIMLYQRDFCKGMSSSKQQQQLVDVNLSLSSSSSHKKRLHLTNRQKARLKKKNTNKVSNLIPLNENDDKKKKKKDYLERYKQAWIKQANQTNQQNDLRRMLMSMMTPKEKKKVEYCSHPNLTKRKSEKEMSSRLIITCTSCKMTVFTGRIFTSALACYSEYLWDEESINYDY